MDTGPEPDPMDRYSHPIETKNTKLTRIFIFERREKSEKPGRSLVVVWDERFPIIKGFIPHYSYVVKFKKAGNFAGDHYHEVKRELIIPLAGRFEILLENIKSKVWENIMIDADDSQSKTVYVPPQISHTVIAQTDGAILLVLATSPNTQNDEFRYEVRRS